MIRAAIATLGMVMSFASGVALSPKPAQIVEKPFMVYVEQDAQTARIKAAQSMYAAKKTKLSQQIDIAAAALPASALADHQMKGK